MRYVLVTYEAGAEAGDADAKRVRYFGFISVATEDGDIRIDASYVGFEGTEEECTSAKFSGSDNASGINGINAAREIRRYDTAVQIIFVTSSSEFAVQSYVVGAYYYQLKPIWKDSFFRLTDAVLAECRKRTQHSLILRCKNGVTRITLDSLEYCEVQGRTLVFHLLDGTVIESSGSMDELARQLADYPGFLRPHRSYLVNMEYIQNITAKSITMESLAEVPLPHGRFTAVRDQYLEYAFAGKKVVL